MFSLRSAGGRRRLDQNPARLHGPACHDTRTRRSNCDEAFPR